ncbi:MAG: FAD-dependent oxidoreductase, partial [Candidatus Gracilibacteria bacterium]|nr:FAD-dependent oxidoreductase [Candidatus Gracilibacteria bacterium]
IATIPLPYLPQLFEQLPSSLKVLENLENVAVACVILKCKRAISENFWMNVNDEQMEIPGIIEFSNLNPLKEKIIYIPFYMHRAHSKYQNSDEKFIQESLQCLQRVDSSFEKTDLLGSRVFRYQYAQPVCEMGYLDKLPPIKSEIAGLYMVDTSYYYPEDRSQSESIRLAQRIVKQIIQE